MHARNARVEAQEVVGDAFDPRILEPSPPAVDDGEWFADDPAAAGEDRWAEWLGRHPERSSWAADRWLGAYRSLGSAPPLLVETRLALHRLSVYVVSPARRRVNGKIGLRWTLGGLGTPFFGADEQIRIVGTELVRQVGDAAEVETITSLNAAAKFVLNGVPDLAWAEPSDVPPAGGLDEMLRVDPGTSSFLGDWYGFAWSVLEELRADLESVDPSRVQLWPEHFDAAFECLSPELRATFGASPGDAGSSEPYLYVLSVGVPEGKPDEVWNATEFRGAVLPFAELVEATDQRRAALEFFRGRRAALVP